MSDINHEIKIKASPEKAFQALSTLNELKCWHTAHIENAPNNPEVLSFKASEKPEFLWKIIPFESAKTVTWECVQGPGDSRGTQVIYTISQIKDNDTLVELKHASWPDQTGNFRKCNTLWGVLLHHLKTYLETGKSAPAIP